VNECKPLVTGTTSASARPSTPAWPEGATGLLTRLVVRPVPHVIAIAAANGGLAAAVAASIDGASMQFTLYGENLPGGIGAAAAASSSCFTRLLLASSLSSEPAGSGACDFAGLSARGRAVVAVPRMFPCHPRLVSALAPDVTYDEVLSNSALNFNMRRYSLEPDRGSSRSKLPPPGGTPPAVRSPRLLRRLMFARRRSCGACTPPAARPAAAALCTCTVRGPTVGRCRLTVSKPVLNARMVIALEIGIS
jgi:hypothetical protein